MNVFIPFLFLLVFASTTIPALAIRPREAEKNPHFNITPTDWGLPEGFVER